MLIDVNLRKFGFVNGSFENFQFRDVMLQNKIEQSFANSVGRIEIGSARFANEWLDL